MKNGMQIRPLNEADIAKVSDFPPSDWHFDFSELLQLHLNAPYFFPVVGEIESGIVAVGHGIRNGDTGWLGNIIVPAEYRRLGYGASITAALVDVLREAGCQRQLLIATQMGQPVYAKLGFRVSGHYSFLKGGPLDYRVPDPNILPIGDWDRFELLHMDRQSVSEDRASLISPFFSGGFVYRKSGTDDIRGYFLPRLGAGLVVAVDSEAGEALLRFKHAKAESSAVVPDGNVDALAFLRAQGFTELMQAPRMVLGLDLDWHPSRIWSRAAGYCG